MGGRVLRRCGAGGGSPSPCCSTNVAVVAMLCCGAHLTVGLHQILNTDALRKGDLKRSNLSPDGTMQMVLQLAHQRMHGYTPSTYESASMAAFKHGRTETIRSATIEANEFVARFQDPACPAGTRMEALRCVPRYCR